VTGELRALPLRFFPAADGPTALVGVDLEAPVGPWPWRVTVELPRGPAVHRTGRLRLRARDFPVQHLTLPRELVDLDPEAERRALAEAAALREVLSRVTPERLGRGPFVRPLPGQDPGFGFGARRVINGQPRAPHTGLDYAAPSGTPVLAANHGQVALVGEFFFPGRLVVLDHGLGLFTLYFHLAEVRVGPGERILRGQPVGTVGATGRATGPHLHFGVQLGGARVDPAVLLALPLPD
jgi:murein DD-endopeptidase MepM/ murein hydrolase activator NlpD